MLRSARTWNRRVCPAGSRRAGAFSAGAQARSQKEEDKEPVNQQELEMKACGPKDAKSSADTDKKNHPTPEAPSDMGIIYVVRPTMMGNKIQTKLAVDGKWLGVNRGNNYFFFTLAPGRTLPVFSGREPERDRHQRAGRNDLLSTTEDYDGVHESEEPARGD